MSILQHHPGPPVSLVLPGLRADGLGPDSPSGTRRVLHNPMVRAVLMVVLVVGLMQLSGLGATRAGWPDAGVILAVVAGTVLGYLALGVGVEGRRPPYELDPRRWTGLLWGMGLGASLFSVAFAILLVGGVYRITGIDTAGPWLVPALSLGLAAGVVEEILLRAGLHRLVEQGLGTWGAVAVSGLVFGLLHLVNPDGTLWGAMAIALEAGLSFGLLYSLTRSLWALIGLHAAWNLVQGLLFGATVSGSGFTGVGLLVSEPVGPVWLSGGDFGPEASPVTVLVMLVWTVGLGVLLVRRGLVVAPIWVRRAASFSPPRGQSRRDAVPRHSRGRSDQEAMFWPLAKMPPMTASTPMTPEVIRSTRTSEPASTRTGHQRERQRDGRQLRRPVLAVVQARLDDRLGAGVRGDGFAQQSETLTLA